MHRLTTSWLCLGVLAATSCGAPAELDESLFPGPNEVGYANGDGPGTTATGTTGTPLGGGSTTGQSPSAGSPGAGGNGASSSPPPPASGASGSNGGGNGNGASPNGGGTPVAAGGSAQAGAAGAGSAPPAGGGATGGCPDDITVLFNRPLADGGCSGPGCHIAEGGVPPDLVSPNVEARLLNVISSCNDRPYIGADDSFLADKVGEDQPECGSPMPFLQSDLLKAADRQCILDWIDEVSGG